MEGHGMSRDAQGSNGRLANLELNDADSDGEESSSEASALNEKALVFLRRHKIPRNIRKAVYNQECPLAEQFIALQSLREIWTLGVIKNFMEVLGYAGGGNLVDVVYSALIRTISILVHIGWKRWSKFESMFFPEGWVKAVRSGRADVDMPHTLSILKDDSFLGNGDAAGQFFNYQNAYFPEIIKQHKTMEVKKNRPLPFIKKEQKKIARGAYGFVTEEVIASYHICLAGPTRLSPPHPQPFKVARKRFQARGDFRAETKNLNKLASALSQHERLVKHLAFITIEDDDDPGASKEFNILLPMADTDLRKLLYSREGISPYCYDIVQLMKEARNLVDALAWLHHGQMVGEKIQVFCHMDLKPDNILVYKIGEQTYPAGCWKISDFGISSMMERRSNITTTQHTFHKSPAGTVASIIGDVPMFTSRKREPGLYSAPEVHEKNGMVGPPSDVWSFGCILLQVLARSIGLSCLEDLDQRRIPYEHDHFCQQVNGKACLHTDVMKWLQSSRPDDPEHTTIQNQEMILDCKELIKKALIVDPKTRTTAAEIRNILLTICEREESFSQSVSGSPVTNTPGHVFPLQSYSGLPHRIADEVSTLRPDPVQDAQTHFLPASPPIHSSDNPSSGGTAYRQIRQDFSPSQTDPPTPPDDHPAPINLGTTDHSQHENIGGNLTLTAKNECLPRDDAQLQPHIPARVSSHPKETVVTAPKDFSATPEPPLPSYSKSAPVSGVLSRQVATPLQALGDPSTSIASITPWKGNQSGSNTPVRPSSEQTLGNLLKSSANPEEVRDGEKVVRMTDSSQSRTVGDNTSTTTYKPAPLVPDLARDFGNNDKSRSLSLPLLQVTTSANQIVNERPAPIQRRSVVPSYRPPNPSALSRPSVYPSQYRVPYAESYHSSQNSSNGENIAPYEGEGVLPRRRLTAATTLSPDDQYVQASTSSEGVSEPQLNPLPDDYWRNAHIQEQMARRRLSGYSSVPSVKIGPTNVHTFPTISEKTKMTLVSSTAAMIAFVAPNKVIISTLYEPACKTEIQTPSNVEWERGSLSGKFLALRGYCKPTKTWVLHFYHLKLRQELVGYNQPALDFLKIDHGRLPEYDKFNISRDGRLLIGRRDKIYLANSLTEEPSELYPNFEETFNLQRVWFSTNGNIAFAWSTGPKNRHRVNWWEARNTQTYGHLKHQSPDSATTADKMRMIHFPRKPLCLLWMNHDLYLLQAAIRPPAFQIPPFPLANLRKVVVTPNEDAVIFITSSTKMFQKPVSKLCFCRIKKTGDQFYYLDEWSSPVPLQKHIKEPDKCEVVIEEYEGSRSDIKVLIAQSDGEFEVKHINLRPMPN